MRKEIAHLLNALRLAYQRSREGTTSRMEHALALHRVLVVSL